MERTVGNECYGIEIRLILCLTTFEMQFERNGATFLATIKSKISRLKTESTKNLITPGQMELTLRLPQ